ncbi:MAG: hypothetical protein AB7I27_09480 [Bacteriovoracaceae bacterium]
MKRLIALLLSLIILTGSLPVIADTENEVIDKLISLNNLFTHKCLPPDIAPNDIQKFYLKHGLTEECYQMLSEINYYEMRLQELEGIKTDCANCDSVEKVLINVGWIDAEKIQGRLECTEERKQENNKNCLGDMTCFLESSAMIFFGHPINKLIPNLPKPKDCNLGSESCFTQLTTEFLRAVVGLFKTLWRGLKWAGKYVGDKTIQFWEHVTAAEDHSSTSQLALAKASEDEGVFNELIHDFPGTIAKIWSGLAGAIKHWLKTDIFCERWSGIPHFSRCEKTLESFDCLSCKQVLSGSCALIGMLAKEILTAFFTGGLLSAAKYGIESSATVAKVIGASKAIQDKVRRFKFEPKITGAGSSTSITLNALRTYITSPARELSRQALIHVDKLMKTTPVTLIVNGTQKTLVFGANSILFTVRGVMMPLSNPLTDKAFQLGIKTFDKLFKFGVPRLTVKGPASSALIAADESIEPLLVKIELNRVAGALGRRQTLELEKKLYTKVKPIRHKLSTKALQEDPDLDDIINYLYPELRYGELAKSLPRTTILRSEKELAKQISQVTKGPERKKLMKEFQDYIQNSEARAKVIRLGQN